MEQSHEEELEDVIARRIIKQAESEEFGGVKLVDEDEAPPPKRGEPTTSFRAKKITSSAAPETQENIPALDATLPTTFIKIEKSLASLGFFTPSSRRLKEQKSKKISFTRKLDDTRVEVSAEIIPSALFGLPVTADQDKYLALQKIITTTLQEDGAVTNPVRFKSSDLLRLLGVSTKTGKNYKEISEWLDVMSSTTIISNGVVYIAGQKRWARDRFRVFDRAVSVGKELEDGSIADANYVWLSEWQLKNINSNFLLPIDLETYRELKYHIAKALVPLLQIWLFASVKAGSFEKRYDELCEILTLQKYPAPSQILRQFKPSLDELTHYGYIEKWRIEKTVDKKAYKIIFFHGPKFHRDRRRRIEQKNQTEQSIIVGQSEPVEPELPEPGVLELGAIPAVGRAGKLPTPTKAPEGNLSNAKKGDTPHDTVQADQREEGDLESNLVDELSARGLMPSSAMKLLRSIPADRLAGVGDFIDYWDEVKRTQVVREGFLYNLIKEGNPLPASFETRGKLRERQAAEDRRQKLTMVKDALESEYEEQCRQTIDRFIAEEFPVGEFERRVEIRKNELSKQGGLWDGNMRPELMETMARHAVRGEIAKSVSIVPYQDFYNRRLPALLAELHLDPKALGIDIPSQSVTGEAQAL